MSVNSPFIRINQLILVGRSKNYIIPFHNGINIIYGDSDTGKSSILNLIDYALGSSEVYLYQEIESQGKYVLLEVNIRNEVYTIKRDIFSPKSFIEVYYSNIANMDSIFPKEFGPSYKIEGPAGYFSDFMLSALNIPLIKLKQAPTKEDSKVKRLSFRDIFKYCYLDQDEVGSKHLLDIQNPAVAVKNRETFKFIHNVLDSQITNLDSQISDLTIEKVKLEKEFETLSKFFRETQIDTKDKLFSDRNTFENQIIEIEESINKINQEMQSDNEFEHELRINIKQLEHKVNKLTQKLKISQNQLDRYIALKKEYEMSYEKFKISLNTKKNISFNLTRATNCPLCNTDIELHFQNNNLENYDLTSIKIELTSLKNKVKELQNLIELSRHEIEILENQINEINEILNKYKKMLDTNLREYISPFISQRDMYYSLKNSLFDKIEKANYQIKLRNQVEKINSNISQIKTNIIELQQELDTLKANAPSVDMVLNNLSEYLNEFLSYIPIKNSFGIRISNKTFLPIVREKDYSKLTSGGLRTLTSIGYLFALLKNSLYSTTQYPSLIMIDTIGKYIGKTTLKNGVELEDEDTSNSELLQDDPNKYKRIYEYLNTLSIEATKNGLNHQIIIVDNDFPEELMQDFEGCIVKRFSTIPKLGYQKGFIDNI